MSGKDCPAASASGREHDTTWALMVQPQPVPEARSGAKPAGSVSDTFTVRVVAAPPTLETVSVNVPVSSGLNDPDFDFAIVRSGRALDCTTVRPMSLPVP